MENSLPVDRAIPAGPALEKARSLTLRYLLTATAILAVSGLIGMLLRDSQAGIGRVGTNEFYALMTVHGLGAFVGWAAFAVMGCSIWVLAGVGFPLRRFSTWMFEACYWLMVIGVVGIVVTTLFMHFAGSWVFLYPLPFHSAGQWSRLTTGLFSASVLCVGLSIVTWCLGILDVVVGPALHAVSKNIFNRLGTAMGFGYMWPKRFATNPQPVPYAVIPLTVIALDMIIATLPLAVLLVEMIVQSAWPGVHVDPLLAKNVLWWFGHPVVYLLLFPAVAIYYLLVPRLAGRPLVAGNVISVAWAIAVTANVVVWAHHIYLDYPAGSPQAGINTVMQPLTFSLTIVSALSLYSLFLTIYRSKYPWNAVSTALFLGLVSWLLAGLSGVVNATIAFDTVIHNTLWIVGHFHQMALLNIGLVIFAACYQFVPELSGKALYSETMARWHVWLTFFLATAVSAIWLVQGLRGAPRRFAVLPHEYDNLTRAAIPFVIALGLSQLLFFSNIGLTLAGKGAGRAERLAARPKETRRQRMSATAEEGVLVVCILGLLFVAGIAGYAIGHYTGRPTRTVIAGTSSSAATTTAATTTAPTTTTVPSTGGAGDATAGKAVFASAGCGGCHTLAAAGATGTVGPNLDQKKPPLALVLDRLQNGKGAMPSFSGQLSAQQIRDVAAFVASSAGGR